MANDKREVWVCLPSDATSQEWADSWILDWVGVHCAAQGVVTLLCGQRTCVRTPQTWLKAALTQHYYEEDD